MVRIHVGQPISETQLSPIETVVFRVYRLKNNHWLFLVKPLVVHFS